MTEVGSSSIHSIGYDPDSRTMRVRFHKGGTYDYPDFPEDKYAAFTGARSHGQFHGSRIKNVHPSVKVSD